MGPAIRKLANFAEEVQKYRRLFFCEIIMLYKLPNEHIKNLGVASVDVTASVMRCDPNVGLIQIVSKTHDYDQFRPQRVIGFDGLCTPGNPLPITVADWQASGSFDDLRFENLQVPSGVLTLVALELDESLQWVSNDGAHEVFATVPTGSTIYQFQFFGSRIGGGAKVLQYWIPRLNKFSPYP